MQYSTGWMSMRWSVKRCCSCYRQSHVDLKGNQSQETKIVVGEKPKDWLSILNNICFPFSSSQLPSRQGLSLQESSFVRKFFLQVMCCKALFKGPSSSRMGVQRERSPEDAAAVGIGRGCPREKMLPSFFITGVPSEVLFRGGNAVVARWCSRGMPAEPAKPNAESRASKAQLIKQSRVWLQYLCESWPLLWQARYFALHAPLLGSMASWPGGEQHGLASLHANISSLMRTSALDCESHTFSSFS